MRLAVWRHEVQDDRMAIVMLDRERTVPPELRSGAVTVGNFDGVHLGHLALIAAARRWADRVGGPAVAVTFDPPPHQVLFPGPIRPPLTTLPERAELLQTGGANHVVVMKADSALLALTAEEFFSNVLVRQFGAKAMVEGYDFRYGRGRAGTNATLRELCDKSGISFEEVAPVTLGADPVSSSRVRTSLLAGEVAAAAALLGRRYRITGTVVAGAKRGRTIGFPTANLADVLSVLPANGVYAVRANVDGVQWPAAANVGPNPTFGEDARKIEVHLIGFSGDLYGTTLSVDFLQKLRETRSFAGVNELVEQLQRDVNAVKLLLGPGA